MISDAQLVLRPMTTHQIGLAGFLHLLVLSQRVRKVAPPHPNGRQDARHSNGSRLLPAIHRSPAGRTNSSLPRLSPQDPRHSGELLPFWRHRRPKSLTDPAPNLPRYFALEPSVPSTPSPPSRSLPPAHRATLSAPRA